jgi:ELWxxDGT repeat protein
LLKLKNPSDLSTSASAITTAETSTLWRTNGTAAGTQPVHDITRNGNGHMPHPSSPASLTRVGARLFFSAEDPQHGRELWALCQ